MQKLQWGGFSISHPPRGVWWHGGCVLILYLATFSQNLCEIEGKLVYEVVSVPGEQPSEPAKTLAVNFCVYFENNFNFIFKGE